jgi:tetratricopeptide (TPR) repeat protein
MPDTVHYVRVLKYKLATAVARRRREPLLLAHRVRHLGDAYRRMGWAAAADRCYVEALSIYREHPQAKPLDLANAIRGFALLKQEGGARDEARRLWQEAHDLYAAAHVPAGVAESAARLAGLDRSSPDAGVV